MLAFHSWCCSGSMCQPSRAARSDRLATTVLVSEFRNLSLDELYHAEPAVILVREEHAGCLRATRFLGGKNTKAGEEPRQLAAFSFPPEVHLRWRGHENEPSYRVKFSTRGRVTIPAPLRKAHSIKSGSRVAFEVTSSGVFLLKPGAADRKAR